MLASYLYILRRSVSNATADLSCLRLKLLAFCLTVTFSAWLILLTMPKIDISSTLSCGVSYSDDFTVYTELVRNWQVFLVPYLLLKAKNLTRSVPGFIKQSFSYYALQVIFYVIFFAIRMSLSFCMQLISISFLDANDG